MCWRVSFSNNMTKYVIYIKCFGISVKFIFRPKKEARVKLFKCWFCNSEQTNEWVTRLAMIMKYWNLLFLFLRGMWTYTRKIIFCIKNIHDHWSYSNKFNKWNSIVYTSSVIWCSCSSKYVYSFFSLHWTVCHKRLVNGANCYNDAL